MRNCLRIDAWCVVSLGMTHSLSAETGQLLSGAQIQALVAEALSPGDYSGKRVLLIVPDGTRTCPLGVLFKAIYAQIGGVGHGMGGKAHGGERCKQTNAAY